MIYLFTGSPGSGKTLSAMEFIEQCQKEAPGRIIYSANIEGMCMPGVLPLDDEGIRRWHEVCEPNSLIVVDEAQRYWRAQRSGDPSQAVIEMETHRHDGIDIVLMTQHPTFLHANIRKLTNVHVHLVAYTKKSALRWEWRECHDDIQDDKLRTSGDFKEWSYPAHLYDFYKSATQHTKRAKRPLKQKLARAGLVFAGLVVLGLAGVAWRVVANARHPDPPAQVQATDKGRARPLQSSAREGRAAPVTAAEYLARQIPRIPSMPWTAPLYDGQEVTSHPRVFCMAVTDPDAHNCRCMTEQGTPYALDEGQCRKIASEGAPYDPYLPKDRNVPQAPSAAPERASAASVAVAMPAGIPAPTPAGVGAQAYEPPTYGEWNPDALAGSK